VEKHQIADILFSIFSLSSLLYLFSSRNYLTKHLQKRTTHLQKMPPKKKSRVPVKSTFDTCRAGNPQAAADAPLPKTPAKSKIIDRLASNEPVLSDAWTDEQETTLFKAISVYRWKPAGKYPTLIRPQKPLGCRLR